MTLSKFIAVGVLTTGIVGAASADTFFHLKVDIGNWKLAIGSTAPRREWVPDRHCYRVWIPERREWRYEAPLPDRRDWDRRDWDRDHRDRDDHGRRDRDDRDNRGHDRRDWR
jgi:hypothetical protein